MAAITQPRHARLVADAAPQLRWIAVTASDAGAPAQSGTAGLEAFSAIDGEPTRLPWTCKVVNHRAGAS